MKGKLKYLAAVAGLAAALVAGLPAGAVAQEWVLYEIVENLDTTQFALWHRVSYWTAQGTAAANTTFCPTPTPCTITAFGTDDIDLGALFGGATTVGTVWANIAVVANVPALDNPVDAPEVVVFTGQIVGELTLLSPAGAPVLADLKGKKSVLGTSLPLIFVQGEFYPDAGPTVRTQPGQDKPVFGSGGFGLDATFRLPFQVGKNGDPAKPERGKNAYYLGNDGRSLIKVDKQNEFALGFPLLRAEVFFIP